MLGSFALGASVKGDDHNLRFSLRRRYEPPGFVEIVDVWRNRIVIETDNGHPRAFYIEIRGRKTVFITSGIFNAEVVENFSRTCATIFSKIGSVVIGDVHHVETSVF